MFRQVHSIPYSSILRAVTAMTLVLLMAACATPGESPSVVAPPSWEPSAAFDEPLELAVTDDERTLATLYYQLLLGELAARTDDHSTSLSAYAEAMMLSDDPRLAAHATRLALRMDDAEIGVRAARRWLELVPDEPDARYALGLFALYDGSIDAGLPHLRTSLAARDDLPAAFTRLGVALSQVPQRQVALDTMQALVAEYPAEPHAQYVLAQVAAHFGELDLATQAVERALLLEPQSEAARLLLIRIHLQAGRSGLALSLLERYLERRPDDLELRLYYARALFDDSRLNQALTQFLHVLEERPRDDQALYGAALIALELEKYEQARTYLLRLINLGVHLDPSYMQLGRLAELEGDRSGAMRWYAEVQGELRVEAQWRMAFVAADGGNIDAARDRLERLRRTHPEHDEETWLVESAILQRSGDRDANLALLNAALDMHPDAVDLLYARALVLVEYERLDAVERDLRAILDQQPDHAHALNALGYTLIDRTDRIREGYQYVRRAYELLPNSPAIIDSVGWAYFRLGEPEKARDYLERAYRDSQQPEIAAHLAEVLWRLGDREAAERILQEALERAPEAQPLLEVRERLER